jgi:hypothetical protein
MWKYWGRSQFLLSPSTALLTVGRRTLLHRRATCSIALEETYDYDAITGAPPAGCLGPALSVDPPSVCPVP